MIRIFSGLALAIFVLASCQPPPGTTPRRDSAPAWALQSGSGETIDFPPRDGKPVILLFWATWCPYCKALMPHLQSILEEFPDSGLRVYALSFMDDGDPVAVVRRQGYSFTVLPQADAVARAYGIRGTPGVFLVGADGLIRFDLRTVQQQAAPRAVAGSKLSHPLKAARVVPYYAAAIRQAVDQLLAESSSP